MIFTEKLVVFAGDNRKLKEHIKNSEQFAYPIKSSLLMFIDPRTLSSSCTMNASGDGYKVSLSLDLKNERGGSIQYTLEKIYKAKDIVKNRTVPLGFSVWPDIRINNWNQYYFFYDGNAQVNILPKNIFSVKDIKNKLQNLNTLERIKLVTNLNNYHQVIGEEIPIQKSTAVTELRSLEDSPEAVFCNVASDASNRSYVEHNKRIDVGLILLPEPQ